MRALAKPAGKIAMPTRRVAKTTGRVVKSAGKVAKPAGEGGLGILQGVGEAHLGFFAY